MAKLLVVDDDRDMAQMLVEYLEGQGHETAGVFGSAEALQTLQGFTADLVLTDLRMKGMDGLELLSTIQQQHPQTKVVVMTAFGSMETAIEAMRLGAVDYLAKPFRMEMVRFTIERALKAQSHEKENRQLRQRLKAQHALGQMVGKSKPMQDLFSLIQRIAPSAASVLIQGESGTGKELVAKAIHQQGPRAKQAFVAINCAAIPEQLLESELFGSARGAYTGAVADKPGLFEEAHQGTLFLDEIGDMPMGLQSKLLRALQEKSIRRVGENHTRKVDVRVISATNQRLEEVIQSGGFREDLYYRLNVIPIALPPLRDRLEDLPLLVEAFLEKCALEDEPPRKISADALRLLAQNEWRGNVRELENVIERACVLSPRQVLDPQDFNTEHHLNGRNGTIHGLTQDFPTLQEIEEVYIRQVLEATHYHKNRTAQILGINRRTLLRKEQEYGIVNPREVAPA